MVGHQVESPKGVYLINGIGQDKPEDWREEKTRNETDIIKTRIKKTIEQDLANDPYAQKVFSELLKDAISEAESLFDHPIKEYTLLMQMTYSFKIFNWPMMLNNYLEHELKQQLVEG